MSKDLLAYFEKIGLQVTKEDSASLYNMLLMPFFSDKQCCVDLIRKEVSVHQPIVNFLNEQVVDPALFSDACAQLLQAVNNMVDKNQLDASWIANALLALIRALLNLNRHQMLRMGSRNKVFCSSYEIGNVVWFEIAVLEVRFRKAASLQNILQKKPICIDLSCCFYKISFIKQV